VHVPRHFQSPSSTITVHAPGDYRAGPGARNPINFGKLVVDCVSRKKKNKNKKKKNPTCFFFFFFLLACCE